MRARSAARNVVLGLGLVIVSMSSSCVTSASAAEAPGTALADVADVAGLTLQGTTLDQSLLAAGSPQLSSVTRFGAPIRSENLPSRSASISMSSASIASAAHASRAAEAAPRRPRSDSFLLILVGVTLVGYQLLRKHRLLRPQPFSL
jgi:hypothetical protein